MGIGLDIPGSSAAGGRPIPDSLWSVGITSRLRLTGDSGAASSALCALASTTIGIIGEVDDEAADVDLGAAILDDDGALG